MERGCLEKRFYRVKEICHLAGLSKAKVHQAISVGDLEGFKLDGVLLISAVSVERYLDSAVPRSEDRRGS